MLLRYLKRFGWLGLTVVLAIAGIVVAAFKDFLGGGALIVAALILAIVQAIVQYGRQAVELIKEQRRQDREEAKLLRIRRPISEVDPFEEGLVFQSDLAQRGHENHRPPYVHRDRDPALREALDTKQFVLILGPSKAGKSRTAFEAACSTQQEHTLMVPASPRALPERLELGLPVDRSRPGVLWLDELDRYLEERGMRRALFDDLGKNGSRVVVLATMTLTAYGRLHDSEGEVGRAAREILDLFEEVHLSNELSDPEREEAESLYPDQNFVSGIGEHFAAARELLDKFKAGLDGHPHGFAVVVAALDWRRAGMSRPITRDELRDLYALCLGCFSPLLEANDEDFQDGLAWVCKPLESRAALLMPAAEEGVKGFEIFDYVRDWSDREGGDFNPRLRSVPEPTWSFVVGRAGPEEAIDVGYAAYIRGNLDASKNAWSKAANSDDSEIAAMAASNLGQLLEDQGDAAGAETAYRQAMDSEHPEVAPRAAFNLGLLLDEQGKDAVGAEQAYQRAMDSGHPDQAPKAAFNLGLLLQEHRDADAERAYQKAMDSEHPEAAPHAAVNLGLLLEKQEEYPRAEEAYQKAMDSGDSEAAPKAAYILGFLLKEQGEYPRSEEACQRAIDSDHPEWAPRAAWGLGVLLRRQEKTGAETAYRQAMDSEHPEIAPVAAFNLGVLLDEWGDAKGAEQAYQRARDSLHPVAAHAAFNLGALLEEQGECARAEQAYRQAMDSGDSAVAPGAEVALERLRSSCSEEGG